jgi:hypothetical protein
MLQNVSYVPPHKPSSIWAGNKAHMGEIRNAYKIVVVKYDGKIPLRKTRHR